MSFLTPLYFLGLAAVSLPILFHLIRRTPRGRLPFSSLMFLSPSPPRLTRRSRLDNLLLLFLRALAVCLLALAFARPFLREAVNLSLNDARGRRVAIVLDTSASMRRGDVWEQAKKSVQDVLAQLEPGDDVGLIAFDDAVTTLVELEREKPPSGQKAGIVTQQVAKLEPSWGGTNLGQATLAAAETLRVANDLQQSDAALQIELISDVQQGAQIEALQAYEWPAEVALSLRRIMPSKSSNATLRALRDEESAASDKVRVRISNSAESAVDQFFLSWNSAENPSPAENLAIYVPPGQSRIVNMARSESSHQATHVLIKGDDFPFDNRCFVTPLLKEELSVCYLGDDEADDPEGLRYYLELAFVDTYRRQVAVSSLTDDAQLDFSGQSPADLVVATSAFDSLRFANFQDYIEAGGCGLIVARDPATAIQLASLDERFQLSDERSRSHADYAMLTEIDFGHPVFAAFSGPQYNDFTKIHFWKHTQFRLAAGKETKILAQFDDGTPALWEQGLGAGKLFVLASGWDPESSTLASSSKFVPLLTGLLDQAAGTTQPLPSFTIHEEILFPAEGTELPVVRTPDGEMVSLDSQRPTFVGTVPGVYELQRGQQVQSFAVNLAARESVTAALDVEQLEQLGVRFGLHKNRTEEIERQRQLRDIELEGRQKVWRWLIIAGLAVLGIETIVAGRLARKTQDGSAKV